MTIAELQRELNSRGVILTIEGGRLKVDAPAGTLTSELKEELTKQKNTLIFNLSVAESSSDSKSSESLWQKCQRQKYPITFEWPDTVRTTYTTSEEAYRDLWARSMIKEAEALGGEVNN